MKIVRFLSQVDEDKCTGDKRCEHVCPTLAIRVIDQKAEVDEKSCVACSKCVDACREHAISMVPRVRPLTIGLNPEEVDQQELWELCFKALLHPEQPICVCSGTLAKEAAAAVLKGAKSPEEVTLMTGARSGCGMYCMSPVLKLLKAHGVEIAPPEGYQWYDVTIGLWDIPEEVARKYPAYRIEEDKKFMIELQAQHHKPHC
jgi:Fe-S-cluster-containing hydrogenase component 2